MSLPHTDLCCFARRSLLFLLKARGITTRYNLFRWVIDTMLCVLLVQPCRGKWADQYSTKGEHYRSDRLRTWRVPHRSLKWLAEEHGVHADTLAHEHCRPFCIHAAVQLPLSEAKTHPGLLASVFERDARAQMFMYRGKGLQDLRWSHIASKAVLDAPAKFGAQHYGLFTVSK